MGKLTHNLSFSMKFSPITTLIPQYYNTNIPQFISIYNKIFMNILSLIKEELNNYMGEVASDTIESPFKQKLRTISKEHIFLVRKNLGNVAQFNIGFKDPEIDNLFVEKSNGIRPAILIDTTNYNYIQMIEPIPIEFRNTGLGKKLYEKLSELLGFISSNPKDNVSGEDRTVEATRVFDSIKKGNSSLYIEFSNQTIFIISPDIDDNQERYMVQYIKKNGFDINTAETNLPPNWKKGLEYLIKPSKTLAI